MKASNRWLGLLAAGTLVSYAAAYTDDDSISCVPGTCLTRYKWEGAKKKQGEIPGET